MNEERAPHFFLKPATFRGGSGPTMQSRHSAQTLRPMARLNSFEGQDCMQSVWKTLLSGLVLPLILAQATAGQQPDGKALPDIRQLMQEVQAHQRQLDKVRESYTYSTLETIQDIDSNGKVTKTESVEQEDFFVNGHVIARTVKKNGRPLSEQDQQKESDRVTRMVEKAEKTPPGQPMGEQTTSISRLLEIMDVRNPRRETYRGRPTIVFDFNGRKDAKTHGLVEDASKKLQGTIWIDEGDRQVAHLEVSFNDNFHVAGGLVANIQKGSNFRFDQAGLTDGLWLPTGGEGSMQARILLVKNLRQHFVERDYDYKRFRVEAQQSKEADSRGGKEAVRCASGVRVEPCSFGELSIQRIDPRQASATPALFDWIDNFAMRNFTNDAVFDDTLPVGDGLLEAGRPGSSRPAAARDGGLVSPQGLPEGERAA